MAETTSTDAVPAEGAIPGLPPDWPQQATNKVVDVVDQVRGKTAGPAIKISRGIVYGLVAAILALIALPLFLIGLTRGLIVLVEAFDASRATAVWVAYAIVGGVLCLLGLFCWSRRPSGAARL